MSNAGSPARGSVLEGHGTFRRQRLTGGIESLGGGV